MAPPQAAATASNVVKMNTNAVEKPKDAPAGETEPNNAKKAPPSNAARAAATSKHSSPSSDNSNKNNKNNNDSNTDKIITKLGPYDVLLGRYVTE